MGRKHRTAKRAFVTASSATTGYLDDHQGAKRILISAAGGHHPFVVDLVRWAPEPQPELVEKWRGLFAVAASGEVFGEARH